MNPSFLNMKTAKKKLPAILAIILICMPIVMTTIRPVQAAATLSITKSDNPDPVSVGANLVYTITYENVGDAIAYNVTITESYSIDVTFVSANPPPDAGTNHIWTIPSLAPDGPHQIVVTVKVTPSSPSTTIIYNLVVGLINYLIKPAYTATQDTTIIPSATPSPTPTPTSTPTTSPTPTPTTPQQTDHPVGGYIVDAPIAVLTVIVSLTVIIPVALILVLSFFEKRAKHAHANRGVSKT